MYLFLWVWHLWWASPTSGITEPQESLQQRLLKSFLLPPLSMLGHFYLPVLSDPAGSVLCGGKPTGTSPNPGRLVLPSTTGWKLFIWPRVSWSRCTLPCKTDTVLLGRQTGQSGTGAQENSWFLTMWTCLSHLKYPRCPHSLAKREGRSRTNENSLADCRHSASTGWVSEWDDSTSLMQVIWTKCCHLLL